MNKQLGHISTLLVFVSINVRALLLSKAFYSRINDSNKDKSDVSFLVVVSALLLTNIHYNRMFYQMTQIQRERPIVDSLRHFNFLDYIKKVFRSAHFSYHNNFVHLGRVFILSYSSVVFLNGLLASNRNSRAMSELVSCLFVAGLNYCEIAYTQQYEKQLKDQGYRWRFPDEDKNNALFWIKLPFSLLFIPAPNDCVIRQLRSTLKLGWKTSQGLLCK